MFEQRIPILKDNSQAFKDLVGFVRGTTVEFLPGKEVTVEEFQEMFGTASGRVIEYGFEGRVKKFQITNWAK